MRSVTLECRYCRCPSTGKVLKYRLTAFISWLLTLVLWFVVAVSGRDDASAALVFFAQVTVPHPLSIHMLSHNILALVGDVCHLSRPLHDDFISRLNPKQ